VVLMRFLSRLIAPVVAVAVLALAGQAAMSRKGAVGTARYTIRAGDTLTGIAARYKVSVQQVAQANGVGNIHRIRIGDTLVIPAAASTSAPVATGLPPVLLAHPERMRLTPLFNEAAKAYGVPADLLKAVTWFESGWQNNVVSGAPAYGIGQLTPDTVKFANSLLKANLDPKKPEDNIRLSARYLGWLLSQTGGDVKMTVASYYQGLTSVRRIGPLPDTVFYITGVLALRPRFV
jgi:murein DD-endopeptidase MepM/ murein hydrolase activator NlpD